VASAGTNPVGLNPDAVAAMREIGIDISHHRSKGIGEDIGQPFDHVITVCDRAKESCPIFPEATCLHHWPFDDPATAKGSPEERKAVFRRFGTRSPRASRGFLMEPTSSEFWKDLLILILSVSFAWGTMYLIVGPPLERWLQWRRPSVDRHELYRLQDRLVFLWAIVNLIILIFWFVRYRSLGPV
jgi:arsenate reductase